MSICGLVTPARPATPNVDAIKLRLSWVNPIDAFSAAVCAVLKSLRFLT